MFKYQYYIIKHKEIGKYKENGLLSPVDMAVIIGEIGISTWLPYSPNLLSVLDNKGQ